MTDGHAPPRPLDATPTATASSLSSASSRRDADRDRVLSRPRPRPPPRYVRDYMRVIAKRRVERLEHLSSVADHARRTGERHLLLDALHEVHARLMTWHIRSAPLA